jgi:hypothetical protein
VKIFFSTKSVQHLTCLFTSFILLLSNRDIPVTRLKHKNKKRKRKKKKNKKEKEKRKEKLSNGHSPQIRENGELLVRMCRGESHFSRKWPLASVRESGESAQHGLANVGEFGESARHGSANVGESARHGMANVGKSGKSAQQGSAQACMIR